LSGTARKLSTLSVSGLLILFAVLPFLSLTTAAALPSNCTQSGISVSCTYYADSALSTSPKCYDSDGGVYSSSLDDAVPAAGTINNGACAVYVGPEIQVTGLSFTTYLGRVLQPFGSVYSNLFAGPSVDAINSGGYSVGQAYIGQLGDGPGSCSPPTLSGIDKAATLYSSSIILSPGEVLVFLGSGSGAAATCTGETAGGQDTPSSFTITGNEVGTTTVTTTATQTQTSTATVTSTVTATAISTVLTNTMVTTGTCITATSTPELVMGVPQEDPTTVTSTVNATTTTTTTTVLTTTVTTTLPVTETSTLTTCTTAPITTTVPQFPVAGLGALALVALLLPVLAILMRARRNNMPRSAV
jgi:hypothetical protein